MRCSGSFCRFLTWCAVASIQTHMVFILEVLSNQQPQENEKKNSRIDHNYFQRTPPNEATESKFLLLDFASNLYIHVHLFPIRLRFLQHAWKVSMAAMLPASQMANERSREGERTKLLNVRSVSSRPSVTFLLPATAVQLISSELDRARVIHGNGAVNHVHGESKEPGEPDQLPVLDSHPIKQLENLTSTSGNHGCNGKNLQEFSPWSHDFKHCAAFHKIVEMHGEGFPLQWRKEEIPAMDFSFSWFWSAALAVGWGTKEKVFHDIFLILIIH